MLWFILVWKINNFNLKKYNTHSILYILKKNSWLLVLVLIATSCFPDVKTKEENENTIIIPEETFSYKTINIPLTLKNQTNWKGIDSTIAKASIENMYLLFEIDLAKINKHFFPVINKIDTLSSTVFNIEFTFNNQPVPIKYSKQKHKWLYRNGFETQADSVLKFSSGEKNLNIDQQIYVAIPMYVFENFKAGQQISLQARVWQDYFMSERKEENNLTNNIKHLNYYKDTLKTTLFDHTYEFALTIPEIYKTELICDSIILQNDTAWSPYGSDNTFFKSSLPDIYFSLSDFNGSLQSSSHVEKSSAKFTTADTLSFYHYKENEPFYVSVYDFDLLTKNDLLAEWKGKLNAMTNNKKYKVKFGHVAGMYIRKHSFGKIN